MSRIKIMVNGMPGNMATSVAKHALNDERFEVVAYSLTGPEITGTGYSVDSLDINLISPEKSKQSIAEITDSEGPFISVDYTHPLAVNSNAEFYCEHNLPFVMGTTGGDRKLLEETVIKSSIPAVVAPNMAKQIVGFQAMMEYGAQSFPDLFKGYSLSVKESHQKGKADTSGTAKAMIKYFNKFGMPFTGDKIVMERDPENQKTNLGIPEQYLTGHGWHTYTLVSEDRTVRFEFTHNVNGRDIYAKGTLDAVSYLYKKIQQGEKGRMFTMIDVLKGI